MSLKKTYNLYFTITSKPYLGTISYSWVGYSGDMNRELPKIKESVARKYHVTYGDVVFKSSMAR